MKYVGKSKAIFLLATAKNWIFWFVPYNTHAHGEHEALRIHATAGRSVRYDQKNERHSLVEAIDGSSFLTILSSTLR